MDNNLKLIGKRIKEIRKKQKLSQEKLAKMTSMNHRSIVRLENAHTLPTLESLDKITKALNIELTSLFKTKHLQNKKELLKGINGIAEKLSEEELKKLYKILLAFYEW